MAVRPRWTVRPSSTSRNENKQHDDKRGEELGQSPAPQGWRWSWESSIVILRSHDVFSRLFENRIDSDQSASDSDNADVSKRSHTREPDQGCYNCHQNDSYFVLQFESMVVTLVIVSFTATLHATDAAVSGIVEVVSNFLLRRHSTFPNRFETRLHFK